MIEVTCNSIRILGKERTNVLYPKRVTKYAKVGCEYNEPRVADEYKGPQVDLNTTNQRIGQNRLNAGIRLHSYFDQLSKVIQ